MHVRIGTSEEELLTLSDIIGDYLVLTAAHPLVTREMGAYMPAVAKMRQLLALTEGFTSDAMLARQVVKRLLVGKQQPPT